MFIQVLLGSTIVLGIILFLNREINSLETTRYEIKNEKIPKEFNNFKLDNLKVEIIVPNGIEIISVSKNKIKTSFKPSNIYILLFIKPFIINFIECFILFYFI